MWNKIPEEERMERVARDGYIFDPLTSMCLYLRALDGGGWENGPRFNVVGLEVSRFPQ